MAKTNIPVQDLDFFKVKENLKTFLKDQSKFQDYDFEGSAMNIHMDMLSYVTHYMGFYAHMLNNESNIDSAELKSSLTSKAKFQNYVPGSKKAAESTVNFTVDITALNEPADRKVVIKRGQTLKSNNNASDNRTFVIVDDVYIYNKSQTAGQYDYTSDDTLIYEGTFETERFTVDKSLINQRFIIKDKNIDLSTLRVRVYDSVDDTNFVNYVREQDYMTINGESPVFFVTLNEDEYYEIQFGNGKYGRAVQNGNMVECTFVSTSGESGNNAKSFTFGGDVYYDGNPYQIAINPVTSSEGGMDGEDIEDLRFNIPYHYRRQQRSVITDDYKSLLLQEYRNINSINVWGGEDNEPKVYGKVFICIKPKFGEVLSSKAKDNIINNIIKRRNVTVIEAEIVDPEYLYVNLDVRIQYNPINTDKSSGEVVTGAYDAINNYNESKLNRFGGYYSDLDLNSDVRASNSAIMTCYTKLKLEKQFEPSIDAKQTYYVDFANPIIGQSVKSDEFTFRLLRCYFADDRNGKIRIYYKNDLTGEWVAFPDEFFGDVDYEKGIVRLTDFEVNGLYTGDKLAVTAKPENPEFFTKRNNIVLIKDVNVTATENFGTEK